jgi:hypothetical protein
MRKLIPAVLLVLAGSWATAQPPTLEQSNQKQAQAQGQKELTAIVVSADPTVKTITIRSLKSAPGSEPETLPVAGAAVASLGSIQSGERVKLVLTMDPATNKESVTAIEKSAPR